MILHGQTGIRSLLAAALLALASIQTCAGQDVVAGWEGSNSRGYTFVSPAASFPANDRWSWVLRGTLSYLYYDFAEDGGRTHVRSPGEALGVGLRYSVPGLTATIMPGYEVRQTRRALAAGGDTRQTETGVTIQGDVFYQATPLVSVTGIISYSDANRYTWGRAGIKRQISNFDNRAGSTYSVGAEVTGQGNSDGRSAELGGLFEIAYPASHASLQFRAGYSQLRNPDGSHESSPYFGVGYYQAF